MAGLTSNPARPGGLGFQPSARVVALHERERVMSAVSVNMTPFRFKTERVATEGESLAVAGVFGEKACRIIRYGGFSARALAVDAAPGGVILIVDGNAVLDFLLQPSPLRRS